MSKEELFPDTTAIIVTLSMQTIKERRGGFRQILSEWQDADGDSSTWWYKCSVKPKRDIISVYWVINGRVRYKSKLAGTEVYKNMKFSNQDTPKFGRAWLVLFDFEPIPKRQQIVMKGFQGFRYANPYIFNM